MDNKWLLSGEDNPYKKNLLHNQTSMKAEAFREGTKAQLDHLIAENWKPPEEVEQEKELAHNAWILLAMLVVISSFIYD